jgi:hypothetical protein
MFENMTFEEWSQSTDPKIRGTLNLHKRFSQPEGLAFFVTLSSVSSVVGNMGQSNYCAGNGFMDALMEWRRNHGLAGCSINVGLVPDASGVSDIIKDQEERLRKYNHLGGTEILTHELQTLLRVIINSKLSLPHQIIAGMTDCLSRKNAPTAWLLDRKFDHRISLATENSDSSAVSTATLLKETDSAETAAQIVLDALSEYLATAMATTADSIDADLPLSALGGTFPVLLFPLLNPSSRAHLTNYPSLVDSLKATDVQNWVSRDLGAELSSFEFLGSQPTKTLAKKIASASSFVSVSS